jgi:hypothetical protein
MVLWGWILVLSLNIAPVSAEFETGLGSLCELRMEESASSATEYAQVYLQVAASGRLTLVDLDRMLASEEPSSVFSAEGGSSIRARFREALVRLEKFYIEKLSDLQRNDALSEIRAGLREMQNNLSLSRLTRKEKERQTWDFKTGISRLQAINAEFSPGGRYLLVQESSKKYEVREVDSGRVLLTRSFSEASHTLRGNFSRDERFVAIVHTEEQRVEVYELPSGKLVRHIVLPMSTSWGRLTFSGDSSEVAITDLWNSRILVWDSSKGDPNPIRDIHVSEMRAGLEDLRGIPGTSSDYVIPQGHGYASSRLATDTMLVLNATDVEPGSHFLGFSSSLDRAALVTGADRRLRMLRMRWKPYKTTETAILPIEFNIAFQISLAANAPRLSLVFLTGKSIQTQVWDMDRGSLVWGRELPDLSSEEVVQAISPNGRYVAISNRLTRRGAWQRSRITRNQHEFLLILDTKNERIFRYDLPVQGLRNLEFSGDGRHVLVRESDYTQLMINIDLVMDAH